MVVALTNDRQYVAVDNHGLMKLWHGVPSANSPLTRLVPADAAGLPQELDHWTAGAGLPAESERQRTPPSLEGWRPLKRLPNLAEWRPLAAPVSLAGWRPLRDEPPPSLQAQPTRPPTGSLRIRILPTGTTPTTLKEDGWCIGRAAMPWQAGMITHWKPNAREDWNRVIHYLEVTFGASSVNESTAARFRCSELEVAHMMLPQPEPLFGLPSVSTSILVLRVDLAFKTGDLWTVIDAPLSVAVFPIFTPALFSGP